MPFEIEIVAALAAMVCWGFGDFFIQRTTRRIGSVESLFFIGLAGSVFLLPFVIQDIPALFSPDNLLLLLFLGILTFVVAMFNFEGLKLGKLSVIDVLLEIELPITVALGVLLLGESLSLVQFGFIGAIFLGSILIASHSLSLSKLLNTFKKPRPHIWADATKSLSLSHWSLTLEKGVAFAVLGAFGMGLLNFVTAVAVKGISPVMAIWAPSVIFTIISFGIILSREGASRLWRNAFRYKELVTAESVLDVLAWVFFAIALFHGSVSITTAITESYPAIALCLGLWFNKERIANHQLAGAGLALLASLSLAILV